MFNLKKKKISFKMNYEKYPVFTVHTDYIVKKKKKLIRSSDPDSWRTYAPLYNWSYVPT